MFKEFNNQKNLNLTNYNYINHKKEFTQSKYDKKVNQNSSNNLNLNNKIETLSKNKEVKDDLVNYQEKNKKYSISTKIYMNNYIKEKEKEKNNINSSLMKANHFNKSQDKYKSQNKRNIEPSYQSKGRNSISNDSNSQISMSRKIKENNKQNNQFNIYTGNKINKEKIRQEYEDYIKNKKPDVFDFQKNNANKTVNADFEDLI